MGESLIVPKKETFKEYPVSSKLDTLFDMTKAIHDQSCLVQDKCHVRFKRLERRRLLDKGLSFAGGVVGGVLAVFGIKTGGG